MTDWITDRPPTEADADSDGDVRVRKNPSSEKDYWYLHWSYVGAGVPWRHSEYWRTPSKPAPEPTAAEPEPQPAPEPAATDRPALAVGQTWRCRDGEVVTIVHNDGTDEWPFETSNGNWYTIDGFYWDDSHPNHRDLVKLINEAPEPAPVSPARRFVSISRTVLSNGDHILDAIDDQGTAWWRRLDTSPHHPAFPAPESKWQQLSPLPAREVPAQ